MQDLGSYRTPPDWSTGAPRPVLLLWFCLGAPLLANRWLPGSAWRVGLLRCFGARIGPGCRMKPGLRVKFPWRLVVGRHCWLGEAAWIDNLAEVTIGDQVCLSQDCYLCTGNHDFRSPDFGLRLGPIRIDDGAWIAARAVLGPGSSIGAGAVIALGSVVNG
ncbi:MAG: putative colanic acid biosynthesis acetyltransferase, partial [Cyanobacteriota bacterium]|nr:putative colanic acid biosynthesis acetyltransferase [Cyanobacteriota bacterium]